MSVDKLLLNNADSFKKVGLDSLKPYHPNRLNELNSLIIPIGVNLSFAAELYLKYLLRRVGKKKNKHNLYELYNLLNPDIKALIEALTCRKIFYLNKSKDDHGSQILKSQVRPSIDFHEKLKRHSNIFEQWRYMHENIDKMDFYFDFNFFLCFINILERYIKTNYPLK